MKGATMLATLQRRGVVPSFSRPAVSNDNAYSEALFKTLKYMPSYPDWPFGTLVEAREWVNQFVLWYNLEHRHSDIQHVTPDQRHRGEDVEILSKRKQVYEAARARNPSRWCGNTRNREPGAGCR
jgi:transposase InsO family protein